MNTTTPKFTPGPWFVKNNGSSSEIQAAVGGGEELRNHVEHVVWGDRPIPLYHATWVQFPPNAWEEMQTANGKLIAAAPDLYAALEAIASLGGNLSDEELESRTGANDAVARGIKVTAARNIANEALKKARGE